MEKISIGFSKKRNSLISKTICLADNSPFSHVYIRRDSKYGEYVYQASGLQVNFTYIDTFLKHNEIIEEYSFELPDDKKDELLSFCIKYSGKEYSMMTLLKLAIMILARKIGIKLKFRGDGSEKFICSELGALLIETILGIEIKEDKDFITPKGLHVYVSAFGERIK